MKSRIDSFSAMNCQKAICARLHKGPSTAEALSASMNVDLALVRYALNGLEGINRVRRNGVLWRLVEPRRVA